MQALLFVAGLAALVGGAELLVRGASRLALSFGISSLVVGLRDCYYSRVPSSPGILTSRRQSK